MSRYGPRCCELLLLLLLLRGRGISERGEKGETGAAYSIIKRTLASRMHASLVFFFYWPLFLPLFGAQLYPYSVPRRFPRLLVSCSVFPLSGNKRSFPSDRSIVVRSSRAASIDKFPLLIKVQVILLWLRQPRISGCTLTGNWQRIRRTFRRVRRIPRNFISARILFRRITGDT